MAPCKHKMQGGREGGREGWRTNQCNAILMGVVRQAVNTSAGNSALWGRV